MHKNLKHFHVRSLSREQVGLRLFDVMSVVRVRDDGVSVFLFMGGFPFYCLFQCPLVWCVTARKRAGMYDND